MEYLDIIIKEYIFYFKDYSSSFIGIRHYILKYKKLK